MKLTAVALVLTTLLHSSMLQQHYGSELASKQISIASNQFADRLFEEIGKMPGNVLVCPISLHVALALVYLGANGETATQLSNVIHLKKDTTQIREGYKNLLEGIKDNSLKIATKLYPAIGYQLNDQYVTDAQEYFYSDVEGLNYDMPASAAKTINTFVEGKTNGKIQNLISSDSLSALTRLVIINAVHFQATWKKTFEKAYDGYFKVSQNEKVKTRMMTQTDTFEYKEDSDLQAKVLKMDYSEGNYSMIFVLPNTEDTLPQVESRLAHSDLPTLLRGLREAKVEVTIPKFSLEMTINLKDVLKKLGVMKLFSNRADLSGITKENLFVDKVIQKTFINVHENGTEAAAATGFLETLSAIPDTNLFAARRPFHFYLINNQPQKMVLFEGRFERPKPYKSLQSSDSLATKIEEEGEKQILYFPEDGSDKRPQPPNNFPGYANGNQKPDPSSNRLPVNYHPPTSQLLQPNRNPDRSGYPFHSFIATSTSYPFYQPLKTRPQTYGSY